MKKTFFDADNLFYETDRQNVYENFEDTEKVLILTNTPKPSKQFIETNKKITGNFKDKTKGKTIIDFVASRPKIYGYLVVDDDKKKPKRH